MAAVVEREAQGTGLRGALKRGKMRKRKRNARSQLGWGAQFDRERTRRLRHSEGEEL
jgi:hypothetical protein